MDSSESFTSRLTTMMATSTENRIGSSNPVLVLHNIVRLCGDIKTKAEGTGIAANVKLSAAVEVKYYYNYLIYRSN